MPLKAFFSLDIPWMPLENQIHSLCVSLYVRHAVSKIVKYDTFLAQQWCKSLLNILPVAFRGSYWVKIGMSHGFLCCKPFLVVIAKQLV